MMKPLLILAGYAILLSAALARAGRRSSPKIAPTSPPRRPARLLIVGGTGGTGRQLVSQALEQRYVVSVLARDPSRLKIDHPRLQVLQGDVLDYAAVDAAVRGQDAVICALGHRQYFRPTRILSDGTRNLLRAMEAHGVPRFVCETSLGIGDSVGRMGVYYTFFVIPLILPFYYWDKTRQETVIADSNREWVIVRPGALTNGEKRGTYRLGAGVGSFLWTVRISRADVAKFMLEQASDNTHLGKAVGVCW